VNLFPLPPRIITMTACAYCDYVDCRCDYFDSLDDSELTEMEEEE
jgi:hypothetical protein